AGPETGVRAPERLRRARGLAARRAVLTRSPGVWGLQEAATPPQGAPGFVRDRERQEPPGPAAETKPSGWLVAWRRRRSLSLSPGRGPTVPRETTSAPSAGAPE